MTKEIIEKTMRIVNCEPSKVKREKSKESVIGSVKNGLVLVQPEADRD